jgi:hypothetical protein
MSRWESFRRALAAESLKIRKTLALWLVSVLPAAPAALQLLLQLNNTNRPSGGIDPWLWFGYGVLLTWAMFVLPLLIALECGLVAGIEHGADGWKQLFSLPVRRGPVYAAKIAMMVALVAAAHVMLLVWTLVAGKLAALFRPELGFSPLPPADLLLFTAVSFLGSWLMIAIHAFIGLCWSSLVLNMGIAIMALLVNLSILESDVRIFYPWFLPFGLTNMILTQVVNQGVLGIPNEALPSLVTGTLGGILVAAAAILVLRRRDVC